MRALVIPCAILLGGCPLLDIETDVSEACLTYRDIEVDPAAGAMALDQSFAFDDLGPIHDLLDLDAELAFITARVQATSGVTSLEFVDTAHVAISTQDLAPLDVYSCTAGGCAPDGAGITVPAAIQTSALDYLKADSIAVTVDFTGRLPDVAWTMDIDVCFSGHAHYAIEP